MTLLPKPVSIQKEDRGEIEIIRNKKYKTEELTIIIPFMTLEQAEAVMSEVLSNQNIKIKEI